MTLIIGSLQLGLIYALLAFGIYITFRILNIPDLTAEGSFTLGLAVCARFVLLGHPVLALFLSLIAGMAAGLITGILQTKLMIHPVLAGILTMSGLYSVNLVFLGSSVNLSLIGNETIFTGLSDLFSFADKDIVKLVVILLLVILTGLGLILFFKTHTGLAIRAVGDNEDMVSASSIPVDHMKLLALAISNGCIALAGGLLCQYQRYADINSGVGILVVGLASVIIGEVFYTKHNVTAGFLLAALGSIVYRFILAYANKYLFLPVFMLKLVSAVIIALALSLPAIKHYRNIKQMKRKNKEGYQHA